MNYTREGKEVTYIHYGASAFDPEKFKPAVQDGCWHKPKGGLWASPIGAGRSWKDWCEGETFRECKEEESFKFTVKDPKRIFFIDSKEAWEDWFSKYVIVGDRDTFWSYQGFNVGFDKFDVDKMIADGYDGLEISLTSFWQLYNYLYGWDCDSIVVFNKEAIVLC